MYHNYAAIFNKVTGQSRIMTAPQFSANLKRVDTLERKKNVLYARPKDFVRKTYDFASIHNAKPFTFSEKHTRLGNEVKVSAYFSYAAGHGVQDHIYERNYKRKAENMEEALKNGKRVLFSIGTKTSHRPLNFRAMRGQGGTTLNRWMNSARGNHILVSVRSAEELTKQIEKIKALCPSEENFMKRTFALYRGGILPYADFDLRERSLKPLFKEVHDLQSGVPMEEGTRAAGFPRLIRFKPTTNMLIYPYDGYPKGNKIKSNDGTDISISMLTFPQKNIRQTHLYNILVGNIVDRKKEVFILSAPSVTTPQGPRTASGVQWEMLRWNISDIRAQTFAQDKEAPNSSDSNNNNSAVPFNGLGRGNFNDNPASQSARAAGYVGLNNQMLLFPDNIYAGGPAP